MSRTLTAATAILAAFSAHAAPSIAKGGIYNSASYARDGALNRGIAPGSVFVVFGSGLGPAQLAQVQSYPLPKELAGVSVKVAAEFGPTLDAYPIYVSAGQIGVILPSAAPPGRANVTVSYDGQTSAPEGITVVRRNVGLFALNQAGSGPAVVQNFVSETSQPLNTVLTPAKPGQTVILWGTGLGAVTGDEAAGPAPGNIDAFVTIYVGGVRAPARYTGRSGCCAGIDQIIFDVPQNVQGCYVPVQIVGGGLLSTRENATIPLDHTVSNSVTMAVARDGAPCTDPTGLTGPELASLAKAGTARIGAFNFIRRPAGLNETAADYASGRFSRFDAATFLQSRGIFGLPAPGSCLQYQVNATDLDSADPVAAEALDAGAVTVAGPGGSRQLSRDGAGNYTAVIGNGFLAPGSYRLSGGGTAAVGAFDAPFTMPAAPSWTNRDSEAYAHSFNPSFNWTLRGPADYVAAYLYGRNDLTAFYTVCTADPASGSFTIPSYAYAGIVQHTTGAPGVIWIGAGTVSRFTIPGLEFGLVNAVAGADGVFIP